METQILTHRVDVQKVVTRAELLERFEIGAALGGPEFADHLGRVQLQQFALARLPRLNRSAPVHQAQLPAPGNSSELAFITNHITFKSCNVSFKK